MYLMKRANYDLESVPTALEALHPNGQPDENEKVDIFADTHPPLNERVKATRKQTVEVNHDFESKYEVEPSRTQRAWNYVKSWFSKK